jgi:hypothetical protein
VGIHQETSLNIDSGINNERWDCKIIVWRRCLWEGRVTKGDEGERIWLMGFIYTYTKIEQ